MIHQLYCKIVLVGLFIFSLSACQTTEEKTLPSSTLQTAGNVSSASAKGDGGILWHIVHDDCVPAAESHHGTGKCEKVDLDQGYAVLKDLRGETHFLVIPTDRMTGIEDPDLLKNNKFNYWQAAWVAHQRILPILPKKIGREYFAVGLNSAHARSQGQLHIHVDCVAPTTPALLKKIEPELSTTCSKKTYSIEGQTFRIRLLEQADLEGLDIFAMLASGLDGKDDRMGNHGLTIVGATLAKDSPGFYLLMTTSSPGSGEALLDRGCRAGR